MGREVVDFDRDVPQHEVVHGDDAFFERGRYLLFIEMLSMAAKDLMLAPEDPLYQESMDWITRPREIDAWISLLDGSPAVVPTIKEAVLTRPHVIAHACEQVIRTAHTDAASFDKLVRYLGAHAPKKGMSSLVNQDETDYDSDMPSMQA